MLYNDKVGAFNKAAYVFSLFYEKHRLRMDRQIPFRVLPVVVNRQVFKGGIH